MNYSYIFNGKSLKIDRDKCTGCGICREVCPHEVLAIHDRKAEISVRGRCMECGACAMNCPFGAIAVEKGVGCAAAIIGGILKGTAPDCGCGCGTGASCC